MGGRRRSLLLIALLCLAAIAAPTDALAGGPQRGALGAGLHAVAKGHAPDASVVTRVHGGLREVAVAVELAADPGQATRERLRSAGLDPRGAWRRTVEGYVRPSRLEQLAAAPGVVAVRAIRAPVADAFVGPGPALHGATPWQQAGYTGAGVKVGVLDVSFDGLTARLGSELPATVQAMCFPEVGVSSSDPADCVSSGETHGTAVAETIVDMAPGAQLYISDAYSPADLAAAISWMTANGVRVINYSRVSSYLMDGMGDGTSPYYNSDYALLDSAVSGGALFVASAGNSGQTTWTGTPSDADADGWVEFAGTDESDQITMEAGEVISVAARWASATSDYDLSLWEGDTVVASSQDSQASTGDPYEVFSFESPAGGTYDLSVRHDSGPAAPLLKVLMWAPGAATLAHHTIAGSLPSPADSRNPGMVTVGAVPYDKPTAIEPYSSQGPTLDGRVKPDLVAVDCAPTTVDAEFCGTSQSAPFVTGAAALLLEADPSLTPVALATLLKQGAVPIGTPVPNNTYGYGRLALGPTPAGAPTTTSFVAPPASGAAGGPLLGQPTVAIVDAEGRVTGTGPGATLAVSLGLAANPTGATLTCQDGTERVAVKGIASFRGCSVNLAGAGYTLQADAPGLTPATSAPFTVAPAGAAPAIRLTLSETTITLGRSTGGVITGPPPDEVGQTAMVEWSTDGQLWTLASRVALDGTGTGRFTATARRNTSWRARIERASGTIDVSPTVLLRVNATAVLASSIPSGRTIKPTTKITFTETIRPVGSDVARGKARFDVFKRVGTSWVRSRTVYANADPVSGRARISLTLPRGRWWVRSRAQATTTNGASGWTAGFKYIVP